MEWVFNFVGNVQAKQPAVHFKTAFHAGLVISFLTHAQMNVCACLWQEQHHFVVWVSPFRPSFVHFAYHSLTVFYIFRTEILINAKDKSLQKSYGYGYT